GNAALAVQLHNGARTDWRCGPVDELKPEVVELPQALKQQCLMLMQRLGIVVGSFHFVVARDGQPVFLKIDEGGPFLFLEMWCPQLPVLDAFCRFLLAPHPGDKGHTGGPVLRLSEMTAVA
ncbi:MAG TPA: hypothetical protein VGP22_17235, partial [Albitalea sp.]|nr:hypothetical protein [Albitalea sp.]